ncbi:MAG: DNA-processing protein DprA [Patescibacteria group bacterium]
MEGLTKEIWPVFFPKMTCKRYQELLAFFDSPKNIWEGTENDFLKAGWKKEIIENFFVWKKDFILKQKDDYEKIFFRDEISCLTYDNQAYPKNLKNIFDPPTCIFIRGTLAIDKIFLAVVGSRKNTFYGRQITEKLITELDNNLVIVSGLAFGIDSIAHQTCLKNKKSTIAVLGGGINTENIYPKEHHNLAIEIINNGGALISEYPPLTEPNSFTFPKRNRIIAGLCEAVLVIEATQKSGALITAECALQNGREVFAVPQNINSENSYGVNELLKNGAALVNSTADISSVLNLQNTADCVKNKIIQTTNEQEKIILKLLDGQGVHIDFLIKNSGLNSQIVNSTLAFMELKGWIKNLGNMTYILNN